MNEKTENKNHYYDGWFYEKFIAPNQDKLYNKIKAVIKKDSKVLDVGCGTGRFARFLGEHYSRYVGVDLSRRNIATAKKYAELNKLSNTEFFHSSIQAFVENTSERFDYSVITYVIHEVDESLRLDVLNSMAKVSDKIIIGDYLIPRPKGLWSYINGVVEFVAGKEHYTNFKNYEKNGGLLPLIEKAGFKMLHEFKNHPQTAHIVVIEKS